MKTKAPAAKMHLVDDETIMIPTRRGETGVYRLRIWRRLGVPAVVLVEHIQGPIPRVTTGKVSNLVLRAYLSHHPDGMHYFELDAHRGLWSVNFLGIGHADRLTLSDPQRRPTCLRCLDGLVGERVLFDVG